MLGTTLRDEAERPGRQPRRPAPERDALDGLDEQNLADAELLAHICSEHKRRPATAPPCPAYEVLAQRLVSYAHPVLLHLLRTRKIASELKDRGIAHPLSDTDYERLHSSKPARDALAIEILIRGEQHFRADLGSESRWRPTGGAALQSWFVTGCLMQLPNAVRAWRREFPEWVSLEEMDASGLLPGDQAQVPVPDIADVAVARALIAETLQGASPLIKTIADLVLRGHTYVEIGDHLGLSARAVEAHLYRLRSRHRRAVKRTATPATPMADVA